MASRRGTHLLMPGVSQSEDGCCGQKDRCKGRETADALSTHQEKLAHTIIKTVIASVDNRPFRFGS
jgi:hypothetical protein